MTNSRQQQLLQSAPLLMPAVALSAGIIAGQHVDLSACWLLFFLLLGITVVLYRYPYGQSVMILLTVAAVGAVRSAMVKQQHEQVEWPEGTVCYEAVIVSEVTEKPKTMGADIIIAGSGKKLKGYFA